jgi:hypothetical protein
LLEMLLEKQGTEIGAPIAVRFRSAEIHILA